MVLNLAGQRVAAYQDAHLAAGAHFVSHLGSDQAAGRSLKRQILAEALGVEREGHHTGGAQTPTQGQLPEPRAPRLQEARQHRHEEADGESRLEALDLVTARD